METRRRFTKNNETFFLFRSLIAAVLRTSEPIKAELDSGNMNSEHKSARKKTCCVTFFLVFNWIIGLMVNAKRWQWPEWRHARQWCEGVVMTSDYCLACRVSATVQSTKGLTTINFQWQQHQISLVHQRGEGWCNVLFAVYLAKYIAHEVTTLSCRCKNCMGDLAEISWFL